MTPELFIEDLIRRQVPESTWKWLESRAVLVKEEQGSAELNKAFAFIPRKTGTDKLKTIPSVDPVVLTGLALNLRDWTIDRLSRVWLLMQPDPAGKAAEISDSPTADPAGKAAYLKKIETLFSGASMNESVALYSALPVLAFPAEWRQRCAEGIRSNIGTVLEAIMYENSYPFHFLEGAAWNQMILKAFFTEKDTSRIIGIDQRANRPLANTLFDYAHERWAAGRAVNPHLWRLTGPFLGAGNFADIQKLAETGDLPEKLAALLACSQSDYPPAQGLLDSQPEWKLAILEKRLRWDTLEQQAP